MNAAAKPASAGSYLGRAINSSIGLKLIMGVTGILLVLWIIAHLAGNLQVFAGADVFNGYAALLKASNELLWTMRIGLLVVVALHIWSGLKLAAGNKAARPQGYAKRTWREASWFSRYMAVSGLIVLAFIVFHLLHFTAGIVYPQYFGFEDPKHRHDAWRMVVLGFSVPWVVLFYLVGMAMLFSHLAHGIWSATHTIGLVGKRFSPWMKKAGIVLAVVLAVGFSIIPLSILAGLVGNPEAAKAQEQSEQQQ